MLRSDQALSSFSLDTLAFVDGFVVHIKSDKFLSDFELESRSAFFTSHALFMQEEMNKAFFINLDSTGVYVFSRELGGSPVAKWIRRKRDTSGLGFTPQLATGRFVVSYVADITLSMDCVNDYRIVDGVFVNVSGDLKAVVLRGQRPNNQGGRNPEQLHLFSVASVPPEILTALDIDAGSLGFKPRTYSIYSIYSIYNIYI